MSDGEIKTTETKEQEAGGPAHFKKPKRGGRRLLVRCAIGLCSAAALAVGMLYVLAQTNFLGAMVQSKVQEAAEKEINAQISMSPLAGNPITGFTASKVEIARNGKTLVHAKNIGVNISMPSLLQGSPKVSLMAVNGVDASLDDILELLPKKKHVSDTPTDIPIETVMITDSTLRTKWGIVNFDKSRVYITNSFHFGLDLDGTLEGKPCTVKGTVEKTHGSWTLSDFSVSLLKGTAKLTGSVYPSADISVELKQLNLTDVAELVPQMEQYGVVGMLSGSASFAGDAKSFKSKGQGLLQNAVIRGFPLEELRTEWNCAPGLIDIRVSKGQVFDSNLTGSLKLEKKSDDTYMTATADIKNLQFADWNKHIEEQTHGKAILLQGGVSSLKADLNGPLNALRGSIDIASSDIAYKEVALKGLHGSAVFAGQASGQLNLSASAAGKKVALSGRLSFGDKVPSDLSFSTEGYPIQNVLRSLPEQPKMKAAGTVSLKARCSGLYGGWRITADASSSVISADKIGVVSALKASGALTMADKKYELTRAQAVWNGASLTASGSGSYAGEDGKKLNLRGTAGNVVLTRFYQMVPAFRTLNLEGGASGTWRLTGVASDPELSAEIRAGDGRFRDIRVSSFFTKLTYKASKINMSPMNVTAGGGSAQLSCGVTLPPKGGHTAWKVSGKLAGVDLSLLNGLLKMEEQISGDVTGSISAGSLPAGGIGWSAKVSGKKVMWRQFSFENLDSTLAGGPEMIKVIKADGSFLNGKTQAEGSVMMPRDGQKFSDSPVRLDIKTDRLNVYELLRRHVPNVRSIQGLIGGTLKVEGTVGDPKYFGQARFAPIRYRGFMLPILDAEFRGSLNELTVSDAHAVIQGGTFKAYGRFFEKDKDWYGDFNIKGDRIELRQFGAYLPEGFRKRFGGVADFSMSGKGKLSEISGKGTFSSPRLRFMGIRFQNISAPFYVSQNYAMIEDLKAEINGGTLAGGVGFDMKKSAWGGNLTVLSTDISQLMKQAVPDMKGQITGKGDLKLRGGGEIGRASTLKGGGAVVMRKGSITSFDAVETAKKYTGGKPIMFETVQATFTYDGGDVNLLPGSQATAPPGDPVYRYLMLDGLLNRKGNISLFAMGKVNIRALNSLLGAFQGLVSAGMDLASGTFDKTELVQNVLGGVLSGFAKNEFRFVTMNINGTMEKPAFSNVKVEKTTTQTSAKESIPTNQSDPDDKTTVNNGNLTLKFKFEVPLGPGYKGPGGDAKGQVMEQTLENVLSNVNFGL